MPLQNRVDPFGEIIRTPARGSMMGNRGGAIHNQRREIVRPFKSRRWITCVLEFRGRRRVVMSPGLYTELFFLDEAVAFAAGHRPCAECRRERYNAFREAWRRTHGLDQLPYADEMDLELHPSRLGPQGQVTYRAPLGSLPDGVFIRMESAAYLVSGGSLLRWTPERYADRIARANDLEVTVLTPQPIVDCFRHGYRAAIHESAG
jgi:hypothetical protein